jgi:NAD-dependent DNA ligase
MEDLIMAHRYLYYVLGEPVISDYAYDVIERQARFLLPPTSPVHGVGSSLRSSYSADQLDLAMDIQAGIECATGRGG